MVQTGYLFRWIFNWNKNNTYTLKSLTRHLPAEFPAIETTRGSQNGRKLCWDSVWDLWRSWFSILGWQWSCKMKVNIFEIVCHRCDLQCLTWHDILKCRTSSTVDDSKSKLYSWCFSLIFHRIEHISFYSAYFSYYLWFAEIHFVSIHRPVHVLILTSCQSANLPICNPTVIHLV